MQISQDLPQFNKKALIIVAGRRKADFYIAFSGQIEKIDSFEIEEPKYSDKEGFFMRLGGGKMLGTGSVLEDKKVEFDRRFIKDLKDKVEEIFSKNKTEEIYLFAANYAKKNLPKNLSKETSQKIILSFDGNYGKSHPFELIKKIKGKQKNKKTNFISEAAMKILKRGRQ